MGATAQREQGRQALTITLELTPELETALKEEAERQGIAPEGLTPEAVMARLIAELKHRPVPQSLDEIKPRRLPPPGKTAMQMVVGQWPGDETDEEIRAALEELS